MSTTKDVLAVIMAGGRGARLHPLTQKRSKPAVPIGGKYRLIDIPISNCINSGINKVAVLTQYNSASLHRHITNAYQQVLRGSLQILAASQTPDSEDWYQGTADALRKQLGEICSEGAQYVLILAGDHLYRMDYEQMLQFHVERKADITVAVHPVNDEEASRLGILACDENGRVQRFVEKPQTAAVRRQFASRDSTTEPYLGSMGIYIFNTYTLIDLLTDYPEHMDFGCDVLPTALKMLNVYAYEFDGFWEDIGTVRSYYEASLAFTEPSPSFEFFSSKDPIYSTCYPLPSSKVTSSELTDVILAEGCEIQEARIRHSIIGPQSHIGRASRIVDSILMGEDQHASGLSMGTIPPGIGEGCSIEGAIVDENARIGSGVMIRPFPRGTEIESENWCVCDGIVVIPKDAEIPAGTVLAPEPPFYPQSIARSTDHLLFDPAPSRNRVEKTVLRYRGRNEH